MGESCYSMERVEIASDSLVLVGLLIKHFGQICRQITDERNRLKAAGLRATVGDECAKSTSNNQVSNLCYVGLV